MRKTLAADSQSAVIVSVAEVKNAKSKEGKVAVTTSNTAYQKLCARIGADAHTVLQVSHCLLPANLCQNALLQDHKR